MEVGPHGERGKISDHGGVRIHDLRNRSPLLYQLSDLVPRSRFGGSRTKKGEGEGKGEEETRSSKVRIEMNADWLFHNAREISTRVFTLYNL